MKKTLFYAGSFDPFTWADAEFVLEASNNCQRKIVIGVDGDVASLLSVKERINAVNETIQWYDKIHNTNLSACVTVVRYCGLPLYAAVKHNAHKFVVPISCQYMPIDDVKISASCELSRLYFYEIGIVRYPYNLSQHLNDKEVKMLLDNKEYIMLMHHVAPPVHNLLMSYALKADYEDCCWASGISWDDFVKTMSARKYHNLSHIAYMLNKYRWHKLTCEKKLCYENERNLRAAIYFHDYNLSSVLESFKCSGLPKSLKGLFLATDHFNDSSNEFGDLEKLMRQLDLSVLADNHLYYLYKLAVRLEYDDVPFDEYKKNRVIILKYLKSKIENEQIFDKMGQYNAINNIETEIAFYSR